jgi:aryl-alcohol dehydrogenase-like predicted oxidoreductase
MSEAIKKISKLSVGLYQGADTESIDNQLTEVIKKAIDLGVNHFDVAPNYRNTRSEKLLGTLIQNNNDIYISTKGGFVPFDFSNKNINEEQYIQELYISKGLFDKESFDSYYFQSFNIEYLEYELDKSFSRLNTNKIDLYYLHNPEYLLAMVGHIRYKEVMLNVFNWLRVKIENNQIQDFGISTWDGFFESEINKRLQLDDLISISIKCGIRNNFKVIQFPFNILKTDAFTKATQYIDNKFISLIRATEKYSIKCFTSAPFGQGKINEIKFPPIINESFYGKNNFQKALSFCLSAPNINTIILGTSKLTHLEEAIEILNYNGHSETQFYNLFNN